MTAPPARPPRWALALFLAWWALLGGLLAAVPLGLGELPVDYRSYAEAAARMAATGSPYAEAAADRETWRELHAAALRAFAGQATAPVSVPYLYPPTLAAWLPAGLAGAAAFAALLAAAAAGTVLLTLRAAGLHGPGWLLLGALSPAAAATLSGGNAELLVAGLAVLACRLVWTGRGALAGPPAAVALLVKPHFLLLFLAFALIAGAASPQRRRVLRAAGVAALTGGALMALEAAAWPAPARTEALGYLADPLARQYFALPPAERWPMELWNRAPMQALVWLGLPPAAAGAGALALWGAGLAAALFALRRAQAGFAPALALAWTLLLIARPLSWSLLWLDLFAAAAAWPALGRRGRRALGLGLAALAGARWAAYAGFLAGAWPGLLSLQTPQAPWESLLLLPGAWALALFAARRGAGT